MNTYTESPQTRSSVETYTPSKLAVMTLAGLKGTPIDGRTAFTCSVSRGL
jgi:hypothetical protein